MTDRELPKDAIWVRLAGGGESWLYLMRTHDHTDPKVYAARHRDAPYSAIAAEPTPPKEDSPMDDLRAQHRATHTPPKEEECQCAVRVPNRYCTLCGKFYKGDGGRHA